MPVRLFGRKVAAVLRQKKKLLFSLKVFCLLTPKCVTLLFWFSRSSFICVFFNQKRLWKPGLSGTQTKAENMVNHFKSKSVYPGLKDYIQSPYWRNNERWQMDVYSKPDCNRSVNVHFNKCCMFLFLPFSGSYMKTGTLKMSVSSTEQWFTVTPSSLLWPLLKPWPASR